jgi:methionyl-tRNA synthetase
MGVRALIESIFARSPDDFYEKSYEGLYCVGCELFKREGEIEDGRCILHPTLQLEWTTERNWFFRLTRYQQFLIDHFDRNPRFLEPQRRRNEILALLQSGLEDISVSRARLTWAVPFPKPTSDGQDQGTWVWFDALPNYLTATGYPEDGFDSLWPASLHVVGKDITRLHCVIWPAMLASAGLPLPEAVWAHGFVEIGGQRFSKSAGVRLALDDALDRHGPDALRYFLLREVPWDGDGNFTLERFDERYTSDLANDLGNLANRTISMVHRYRAGQVPDGPDGPLDDPRRITIASYSDRMGRYLLHEGAAVAFKLVSEANSFVEAKAPWKLAKAPDGAGELDATLAALVRTLATTAVLLSPFMPRKMDTLWRQLGSGMAMPVLAAVENLQVGGWKVEPAEALFPRPERAER